ncbi:MAG TPA: acetoin utilization protein AcuC, partial [Limnochordales bacterium]
MGGRVAFLWDDGLVSYRFSEAHPLNPMRLVATLDLLRTTGLLQPSDIVSFGPASADDLALVHDRRYIAAVQRFSAPQAVLSPSEQREALAFGLGTGDNPLFP